MLNRSQRRKYAKTVDIHDKDSMLAFLKGLTVVQPGGQKGKMTFFQLESGAEITLEEASEEQLRVFVRKILLNGVAPARSKSKQNEAN